MSATSSASAFVGRVLIVSNDALAIERHELDLALLPRLEQSCKQYAIPLRISTQSYSP